MTGIGITQAAQTLPGIPEATFAPPRLPVTHNGLTLRQECAAIEAKYPGYHVWHDTAGYFYATHANPDGSGYTVECHGITRLGEHIAVWEHERQFAGGVA